MSRRAMPRPLDIRLDQAEGRRTAGAAERGSAAIRRGHIWRAEAAMGTVIRSALARAGIDAAQATRLCLADEAAAALAALSDTPELERADGSPADGEAHVARRRMTSAQNPGAGAGVCRRAAARFRQSLLR